MTPDELRERTTVTVPEAGHIMGLGSDSAAYRAAANGTMPGVRQIGGRKVVSAPALIAWLEGRPTYAEIAQRVKEQFREEMGRDPASDELEAFAIALKAIDNG